MTNNGIPKGAKKLEHIEVYLHLGHIIILGTPMEEPDDLTPEEFEQWQDGAHNCDQMGCGATHVLYRFPATPQ